MGHQIPVAPQRVLEQPSELGVPVGHVHYLLALVSQGADHITQGQLWERVPELKSHTGQTQSQTSVPSVSSSTQPPGSGWVYRLAWKPRPEGEGRPNRSEEEEEEDNNNNNKSQKKLEEAQRRLGIH